MTNVINTEYIKYVEDKYERGQKLTRKESIFYNGKPGTLKPGYLYGYTNEEIKEFAKCAYDIVYFIEKYCKIRSNVDGKLVDFKLYDFQKEILREHQNNNFLLFFNSRQIGFSNLYACIYLYFMLFKTEKSILSIHNKTCTGIELIDKIKNNYLHLPYFLKRGVTVWNKTCLSLENFCKIKVESGQKYPGIGSNYDIYHIHDFAHIPPNIIDGICKTIIPTVCARTNCKLIISSSPNGKNLFKKMVNESELKEGHPDKNDYKTIRTYWWEVPGRDNSWREEQISILGEKLFEQEYNLKFL